MYVCQRDKSLFHACLLGWKQKHVELCLPKWTVGYIIYFVKTICKNNECGSEAS